MGSGTAAIDIDASADQVWKVAGDFGGIGWWMPGIDSCRVEGDDRIISTMGMTITERLVARDDAGRSIAYAIADGGAGREPRGRSNRTPTGDTCHVTWEVKAPPDEMADLMVGVYQQALEALKAHVEG